MTPEEEQKIADRDIDQSQAIVKVCSQVLEGKSVAVQGMVVAHLLALWLAGFQGPDRKEARADFLKDVMELVDGLVATRDEEFDANVDPRVLEVVADIAEVLRAAARPTEGEA